MDRDTSRLGKFRDDLAWRIANFALNRIATPWYSAMIQGAIKYGLDAAATDTRKQFEERMER